MQAFYLTVIPILYRSPRIVANIQSFFYHSDKPYPPDINTIDNAELVRAGYTKLPALRYVRALFVDVPGLYEAENDEDLQMTDEQKCLVERDQTQALRQQMAIAEKHLKRMPMGALRSLKTIRTGDAASVMNTPRKEVGDVKRTVSARHVSSFTQELLQRSSAEIWCETPRSAIYLSLRLATEATSEILGAGSFIVNHVQPCDYVRLIRNATNYVYVHPWTCPNHAHKSSRWYESHICGTLTVSRISQWLSTSIGLVFSNGADPTSVPVDKGRIIIGGLYESIINSLKYVKAGDEDAEDESWEPEWYRSMRTALTERFEGVVDIEFRRAKDMSPCPGCRALCG